MSLKVFSLLCLSPYVSMSVMLLLPSGDQLKAPVFKMTVNKDKRNIVMLHKQSVVV